MFQRESLDILKLSQAIKKCDAILIGAGAGLSSAAGLSYSGNRFKKYFNDFITKISFTRYVFGRLLPLS